MLKKLYKRIVNDLIKNFSDLLDKIIPELLDVKLAGLFLNQRLIKDRLIEIKAIDYIPERVYTNKIEPVFIEPFFSYIEQPDFQKRYLKLIDNLPEKSIYEINKILSRIIFIKAHPQNNWINFYSPEEQAERIKLVTDFSSKVLRISDQLYVYGPYKLPIKHFEPCVFLHKHGIQQVKNLTQLKNKDFIDAGAFIGDSALVLSKYTEKNIYSFEANPENIELLYKTLELNNLSNVTVVSKALYSTETEIEFNLNGSVSGFEEVKGFKYNDKKIRVKTTTLDSFVQEHNLDVGLIKVDLEGAEQEFLKGAVQTIKSQRPVLLLSIYHKPSDFFEIKPLIESWGLNYEFSIFSPVDYGIMLETMIIAQ